MKILTTMSYLKNHPILETLRGETVQILVSGNTLDIPTVNKIIANNLIPEFIETTEKDMDFLLGYIMGRSLQGSNSIIVLTEEIPTIPVLQHRKAIISNDFEQAKEDLARIEAQIEFEKSGKGKEAASDHDTSADQKKSARSSRSSRSDSRSRRRSVVKKVNENVPAEDTADNSSSSEEPMDNAMNLPVTAEADKTEDAPAADNDAQAVEVHSTTETADDADNNNASRQDVAGNITAPVVIDATNEPPVQITDKTRKDYSAIKKLLANCGAFDIAAQYGQDSEDEVCEQVVFCLKMSFEVYSLESQLRIKLANKAYADALYKAIKKSYDQLRKAAMAIA